MKIYRPRFSAANRAAHFSCFILINSTLMRTEKTFWWNKLFLLFKIFLTFRVLYFLVYKPINLQNGASYSGRDCRSRPAGESLPRTGTQSSKLQVFGRRKPRRHARPVRHNQHERQRHQKARELSVFSATQDSLRCE